MRSSISPTDSPSGRTTTRKRVVVDAAGYRERRAVALQAAADQAAEAAVQ